MIVAERHVVTARHVLDRVMATCESVEDWGPPILCRSSAGDHWTWVILDSLKFGHDLACLELDPKAERLPAPVALMQPLTRGHAERLLLARAKFAATGYSGQSRGQRQSSVPLRSKHFLPTAAGEDGEYDDFQSWGGVHGGFGGGALTLETPTGPCLLGITRLGQEGAVSSRHISTRWVIGLLERMAIQPATVSGAAVLSALEQRAARVPAQVVVVFHRQDDLPPPRAKHGWVTDFREDLRHALVRRVPGLGPISALALEGESALALGERHAGRLAAARVRVHVTSPHYAGTGAQALGIEGGADLWVQTNPATGALPGTAPAVYEFWQQGGRTSRATGRPIVEAFSPDHPRTQADYHALVAELATDIAELLRQPVVEVPEVPKQAPPPRPTARVAGVKAPPAQVGAPRAPRKPERVVPAWAKHAGDDDWGHYADFELCGVVQRMRWLKAGSFMMGEGAQRHQVTLTQGLWLADTQCTQAMWEAVMGTNPSYFKGARRPVEQVSWNDVSAFLAKARQIDTQSGLRLPTEAEWEYGCRAGTATKYWWGDDEPGARALYRKSLGSGTEDVDARPANPWGLYGVAGNVWEWCSDWYAEYKNGDRSDPTGPEAGEYRVLRGGSFNDAAVYLRSAYRYYLVPVDRDRDGGFRLARGR